MKISDLPVVILEERSVSRNPGLTARVGRALESHILCKKTFYNNQTFGRALYYGLASLITCKFDGPKLLIVSAHGRALTGTHMSTQSKELIDWKFYEHFLHTLPKNLYVFFSVCYGAYPSALCWHNRSDNKPVLIGPLVNIFVHDAVEFQDEAIKIICAESKPLRKLKQAVSNYNRKLAFDYQDRKVMRVISPSGSSYPKIRGGQLAAAGHPKEKFTITGLGMVSPKGDLLNAKPHNALFLIVENSERIEHLLPVNELWHLNLNYRALIGKTVELRYQRKIRKFRNGPIRFLISLDRLKKSAIK